MLRLTSADINGKSYDKEVVSAVKLASIFGITMPTPKMEFHLSSELTHIDRFGQHRRAEGLKVKPRVSATYNGSFVVIEYYEREVDPTTPGGDKGLLPRHITVTMGSHKGSISEAARDQEKAVILALRPDCETSPLHKKGSTSRFKLYNPELVAESKREMNKAKFRAWSKIHNGEIGATQLGIIAAGMGIKTNNRTFVEISSDLEEKAAVNPANFEKKSDDRATLSLGLVKRCRDLNVVSFVSKSGKSYLVIDETLAEATGNSGLQVLNGGYASPNEGQSALIQVLTREDIPFIALREMLELAESSNIKGNASGVKIDEERTSTAGLFAKKNVPAPSLNEDGDYQESPEITKDDGEYAVPSVTGEEPLPFKEG